MTTAITERLSKIESVLSEQLPSQSNSFWQKNVFSTLDACVTSSHFSGLIDPCHTLLTLGGKRWRPLLLVLTAELASQAKGRGEDAVENAYKLTPLVEFAHTASLIHDDIEDCADTRRGKPCAHLTYGEDTAINAGSWLYFLAPACIDPLPLSAEEKNTLYSQYLLELRRLHLGQAMDILWHRNPSMVPTENEYVAMVQNKTGTLSRLAVKIGMLAGGASVEEAVAAGKIAEDIGVGFQIIDDVINLTTGNPGKKRGDDIVEGKKSLPVLIHLAEHPDDRQGLSGLFEIARRDGIDSPSVEEAIDIMTESGAVEKARILGNDLVRQKSSLLAEFFGSSDSPASRAILELFEALQKK